MTAGKRWGRAGKGASFPLHERTWSAAQEGICSTMRVLADLDKNRGEEPREEEPHAPLRDRSAALQLALHDRAPKARELPPCATSRVESSSGEGEAPPRAFFSSSSSSTLSLDVAAMYIRRQPARHRISRGRFRAVCRSGA